MPANLALLLTVIFVIIAFRSDRKRGEPASNALIWPSLWYLVTASHPLGVWLQTWGVPIPGGSNDPTDGSFIDRYFFGGLTLIGLWILSRRQFDWGDIFRRNRWLTALIILMAASILWSQYPFVSFKRFIKIMGSVVMAFVVLTENDPFVAFTTVLRRCLYIHLPMSIICVKYFRSIGVNFDWSGTAQAWQGISTTKNVLGQVAMLGVVYFFWEVRRHWKEYGWRNLHLAYLLMALHLLRGSEQDVSMTSISVCLFAMFVFLRIQALRARPEYVRPFVTKVFYAVMIMVCLVVIHGLVMFPADSIFGKLITVLGRNITLTDRTYIWSDVYAAASRNPFFGVGFGGFWIGRLVNIPWNANMTWVLGQAHSGYVDTFLQLGIAGWCVLAGVIFSTFPRLIESLDDNFDFGCFKITLFLTILFVDMTESVYLRGDHHLWFILMVIIWNVPVREKAPAVESADLEETRDGQERMESIPSMV